MRKGSPRKTDLSALMRLIALTIQTLKITPNNFLRVFNEHAEAEGVTLDGETWEVFIQGIMSPSERKRNMK